MPLNTETPAWAIDRLSILALKIYHMKQRLFVLMQLGTYKACTDKLTYCLPSVYLADYR